MAACLTPADIPAFFQPADNRMLVHDPTLKAFSQLWIDMQQVEYTAAMLQCVGQDVKAATLCVHHLKGGCVHGEQCQQVHIAPDHMKALRSLLKSAPHNNCCALHGDLPSKRLDLEHFRQRLAIEIFEDGVAPIYASPHLVAMTAYWQAQKDLPLDQPIRVRVKRICQLHQGDRCHVGMACGNVHICREFWQTWQKLSATEANTSGEDAAQARSFFITPSLSAAMAAQADVVPVAGTKLMVFGGSPDEVRAMLQEAPTLSILTGGTPTPPPGFSPCHGPRMCGTPMGMGLGMGIPTPTLLSPQNSVPNTPRHLMCPHVMVGPPLSPSHGRNVSGQASPLAVPFAFQYGIAVPVMAMGPMGPQPITMGVPCDPNMMAQYFGQMSHSHSPSPSPSAIPHFTPPPLSPPRHLKVPPHYVPRPPAPPVPVQPDSPASPEWNNSKMPGKAREGDWVGISGQAEFLESLESQDESGALSPELISEVFSDNEAEVDVEEAMRKFVLTLE